MVVKLYTRDQAICMYFCEEYNEENARTLEKRIRAIENVEICYMDHPNEPVLVYKTKINGDPARYHYYPSQLPSAQEPPVDEDEFTLDTDAQVNQFINTVYSPVNLNSTMYKYEKVQMKHVYNVVCRYTDLYADKNLNSFTAGCTYKTIDFMNVASKRRMCNGKRISERDLYVLKPTYHAYLVENISSVLPAHKNHMRKLKEDGYVILGYARKSTTPSDNRVELLNAMCENLRKRSLVQRVYVSPNCDADDRLQERDVKKSDMLNDLDVDGDLQDLLEYITGKDDICLVVLDHRGLTTNPPPDLKSFLRKFRQIKRIIVDKIPFTNEIAEYDCADLVEDESKLNEFAIKQHFYQRSHQ